MSSKPMVPWGRSLNSIGYTYNEQKVLYFIVTDNTGSTQVDLPYLSKYPGQFYSVANHPVDHLLVMYRGFLSKT